MPAEPPTGAIPPKAAVDRAFRMVNGPVFLVMFGPAFLAFLLGSIIDSASGLATAGAIVAFLVCWPLAWLTWSILTPRWRLWAYQRVDDIDELKRLAVIDRVIWPEGHLFGRSEIASKALRARLRQIEQEKRAATQVPPETSPS